MQRLKNQRSADDATCHWLANANTKAGAAWLIVLKTEGTKKGTVVASVDTLIESVGSLREVALAGVPRRL